MAAKADPEAPMAQQATISYRDQSPPPYSTIGAPGGVSAYYRPDSGVVLQEPQPTVFVPQQPEAVPPYDFLTFAVVTAVLCGLFSPITLVCSLPAIKLSVKARRENKAGYYTTSKTHSKHAVMLIVATVTCAMLFCVLGVGLTLGLYGPKVWCFTAGRYSYSPIGRYDCFM